MVLLNGSANRDDRRFPDGDRFDIHRDDRPSPQLRLRHPLLPRRRARPPRGAGRARRGARPLARVGRRLGQRQAGPHGARPWLGEAAGDHRLIGRTTAHADGRHDPGEHRRPHGRAARHVREPRPGQVEGPGPQGRAQRRSGVDEWEFQGQATSTPFGMAATVGWPKDGVGLQPGLLLRAAARLLRRARAGEGHERQRRAGVDELPDHGRLQRPHVHRGRRQGARARLAPGLQRLGHRRVGRQLPGPVHPARPRPDVGRRPRGRGGAPPRQEGLPLDQLPRDAARPGLPELPVRPLGPDDQGPVRRRT